jgi:hypothetical protein
MPDLAMSSGVRRREQGSLRPSVLFNMFLEKDEEAPDGFARQSRQGLTENTSIGNGPVNGLFSKPGVSSDALFAVSGSSLYRNGALLMPIVGAGAPSWAASASEVAVTRGTIAYSYNGAGTAAIVTPGGWDVTAIAFLGGYTFFARAGTHRIYWSTSGDARTIDALDFVSAESEPDELLDLYVVNDSLWALGRQSVEMFQLTGDLDAVIARVEGILLKKGITATGAAAEADNTLFWWGHDHFVYRAAQGAPQAVSEEWLAAIMERSALRGMFAFSHEGKIVVCVRTDEGSFGLDVATGKWVELGSYGRTGWRVANATVSAGTLLMGDDTNGTIWEFDPDNWDDGDYLERRFSASFNLPGGTIVVSRLGLVGNPGDTPLLSGQGSDPVVEIRSSRDNGNRWGDWRSAKMGAQGRYRQRIEKRRWGLFDSQGGLFEFRVTDPVPFRASRVFANEPSGGRASRHGA